LLLKKENGKGKEEGRKRKRWRMEEEEVEERRRRRGILVEGTFLFSSPRPSLASIFLPTYQLKYKFIKISKILYSNQRRK